MASVIPLDPAPVDIKGVRAGDLNQFKMTITSAGAPVDLTGMEVTASARIKSHRHLLRGRRDRDRGRAEVA